MNIFAIKNKTYSIILVVFSIIVMILTINQLVDSRTSSASIIKKYSLTSADGSIKTISYNGVDMYTAKATFYDYYSDSQVGTTSTPLPITDALATNKNTFSKFNNKIMSLLNYNNSSLCPANYPLYQGRPGGLSDMLNIYNPNNEQVAISSNYWYGAQSAQGTVAATQGLVDPILKYDSYGNKVITQTNSTNNKTSILPYFDKKFLTTNTFDNSSLSLGSVLENVYFPFRREDKNGVTYYTFESNKDTVKINDSKQLDYYGTNNASKQVLDAKNNPGFFPYNNHSESNSKSLNYGHGVKLEIPFNMTKDGKLKGFDMVFEFSGDDDVWVYIDDELALDIGGNHGEVSGTINFATGISTVKKVKNPTVAFTSRHTSSIINLENSVYTNYETNFSNSLLNKLKDTTKTHTLTMFYMERGLNVANMKLTFNLPEPTKLLINNIVDTSKIGATFIKDTKEISTKDEFIMDVADKTLHKAASIGLLPTENVAFLNEFDAKDTLIIQEKALKSSSRKLTELYSTTWELRDIANEISKGSSLIIKDNRSSDNTSLIFSNKNNNDIPVLSATYTNTPKTGDYMLCCNVTDSYKKKNTNYSLKEFTYIVTHKNIFGSNSDEKLYSGKYTLYDANDKSITKQTSNGTIKLKPGEKAAIKDIPVTTIISSTIKLDNSVQLSAIQATPQFKINNSKSQSTGEITTVDNVVQYTITTIEEEIKNINNDNIPLSSTNSNTDKQSTSSTKLIDIDIAQDAFDSSPQTADTLNIYLLYILLIIATITILSSTIILTRNKSNN